ncbi:hypothetical protein QBC47DRAFT_130928 [Echria macrotheca]|uniref:Ubiquitin-like protease family profile domain-containing protein n=1 Tax=Echria macrotheca TaxID=438768 RepID=A0AAJ0B0Y8_9PEZI|nr:hypothetical protein QBC47DRAFT_130928 [Echria macrotheca]
MIPTTSGPGFTADTKGISGGRHIWQGAARLPATPEASSDLIKIVRYISNLGRDPRTLWQEGGELFGVDFTRRKLDIVWKDIRARGNRQRGVVGLRREPAGADESSEEPEAPRNQRDHSEAVPVSDDGHDQELRVEAARSDPAEVGDDHPLPLQEDALDHIFNSSPPPSRGRSPIQDPEINRSHSPVPELVLGSDPPESPISQPPAAKRLRGNVDAPVPLPLGLPHGVHAECLEPGQRLSGTTILYILQQIVALCPLSFRVVDPLLLKGEPLPSRAVSELIELPKFRAIIAPVHVFDSGAQHWALAVVSPDSVRIFDSFPPASADVELRAKLCGLLTTLNVDENIEFLRQPCPRQINDSDCGVAVIVNAIHIIARVPVPAVDECDYGIWRRVFIALITRGSLQLDCPGVPILTADVLPPRLCTLPPQFTIAEYRAWQQEQAKTVESQFEELLVPRRRIAESLENVIEVLDALLASTSESGRRFPGISFTELDLQINICTTGLMADADNYGVASPEFEKRSTRLHRLRGLEARRQDALDRIMELYEKIEGGLHDLGRE